MAAPIFTNMLGVLFDRLGDTATYQAVGGSAPRQVSVKFDQAGADDGSHVYDEPRVRVKAADFPEGIKRGDAFTIGGTLYRARQGGMSINDGNELEVPLGLPSA